MKRPLIAISGSGLKNNAQNTKSSLPWVRPHRKPNQATLWSRKLDAVQKRGILPWQFRTGDFISKVHVEVQTIPAWLPCTSTLAAL